MIMIDGGTVSLVIAGLTSVYAAYELLFNRIEIDSKMKELLWGELSFSYRKIEKEIGIIEKNIKRTDFRPTKIIGFGGGSFVGGYVVGALLASRKHLDIPFIPLDFKRPAYLPDTKSFQSALEQITKNDCLLLVDDGTKRGDTIINTIGLLEKEGIQKCNMKVAIIIRYSKELVLKEFNGSSPKLDENFWENNFCNCIAKTSKIKFPWQI